MLKVQTIVRVAHNTVDELTRREQRQVRLEEDFVLQLPFLLPEDNYSCDIIKGVPGGLTEFIAPLQRAGLCVMTPQPTSLGKFYITVSHYSKSQIFVQKFNFANFSPFFFFFFFSREIKVVNRQKVRN